MEAAEDAVGEISIEDLTTINPDAARAINFKRTAVRCQLIKKTKEHIEAEKHLLGKRGS